MEQLFKGNDGKIYNTEKECRKADEKWNKAHETENKVKQERTTAAKDIQALANEYLKMYSEHRAIREKLQADEKACYDKYRQAIDDFSQKYDGYRLTYTRNGDNVEFKVEEARNESLEEYYTEFASDMFQFMSKLASIF